MDPKKSKDTGSNETVDHLSSSPSVLFLSLRESHADDVCSMRNAGELSDYAYWPLPFTKNDVLELIKYQRVYLQECEKTYLLYSSGEHKFLGEVTVEINQHAKDHIGLRLILGSDDSVSRTFLLQEIISYVRKLQQCHKIYVLLPAKQTDLFQDLCDIGFAQEAYMKKSIKIQNKWEDEIYLGCVQR